MRNILLLDDEPNVLLALQRSLRQGFAREALRVETFTEPEAALLRCGETSFDVVVSDYRMPGMNGIDFLRMVRGIQPDAVRLALSASTEFRTVMQAINEAQVFRYIAKPWRDEAFREAMTAAFAHRDAMAEDRRLADELRAQRGVLSAQELEARRLEAQEPGITKVRWNADGAIELD